jgi:hypothetical protein
MDCIAFCTHKILVDLYEYSLSLISKNLGEDF